MTNGTIPSGRYDGKIVGTRLPNKSDKESGTRVALELIGVGQRLVYHIPPMDRGYLARKNILYFADCPFANDGDRDYWQLKDRYVGVEIESLKHADGRPYVRIRKLLFSELQFFPSNASPEPKKRS